MAIQARDVNMNKTDEDAPNGGNWRVMTTLAMSTLLASLGASIANIAIAAAFLAASEGSVVSMRHLVLATCRELQKLGKSVSKSEFGVFAQLLDL